MFNKYDVRNIYNINDVTNNKRKIKQRYKMYKQKLNDKTSTSKALHNTSIKILLYIKPDVEHFNSC